MKTLASTALLKLGISSRSLARMIASTIAVQLAVIATWFTPEGYMQPLALVKQLLPCFEHPGLATFLAFVERRARFHKPSAAGFAQRWSLLFLPGGCRAEQLLLSLLCDAPDKCDGTVGFAAFPAFPATVTSAFASATSPRTLDVHVLPFQIRKHSHVWRRRRASITGNHVLEEPKH